MPRKMKPVPKLVIKRIKDVIKQSFDCGKLALQGREHNISIGVNPRCVQVPAKADLNMNTVTESQPQKMASIQNMTTITVSLGTSFTLIINLSRKTTGKTHLPYKPSSLTKEKDGRNDTIIDLEIIEYR